MCTVKKEYAILPLLIVLFLLGLVAKAYGNDTTSVTSNADIPAITHVLPAQSSSLAQKSGDIVNGSVVVNSGDSISFSVNPHNGNNYGEVEIANQFSIKSNITFNVAVSVDTIKNNDSNNDGVYEMNYTGNYTNPLKPVSDLKVRKTKIGNNNDDGTYVSITDTNKTVANSVPPGGYNADNGDGVNIEYRFEYDWRDSPGPYYTGLVWTVTKS